MPYKRITYFREWMNYIRGYYPTYFDEKTKKKIIDNLREPTLQSLRKTLKKLKLGNYKGVSYLLSEITGKGIPDVLQDMPRAKWIFSRISKDIPYHPNVIYEIFHKIEPNHPLLGWIPRRLT